jgi:hypothetical protein
MQQIVGLLSAGDRQPVRVEQPHLHPLYRSVPAVAPRAVDRLDRAGERGEWSESIDAL